MILTAQDSAAAAAMLFELSTEWLHVEICPAPRPRFPGHLIRVVYGENPKWYQRLCEQRTRSRKIPRRGRKHDTDIGRPLVIRALERMSAGRFGYPYDELLLPEVRRFAKHMAFNAA